MNNASVCSEDSDPEDRFHHSACDSSNFVYSEVSTILKKPEQAETFFGNIQTQDKADSEAEKSFLNFAEKTIDEFIDNPSTCPEFPIIQNIIDSEAEIPFLNFAEETIEEFISNPSTCPEFPIIQNIIENNSAFPCMSRRDWDMQLKNGVEQRSSVLLPLSEESIYENSNFRANLDYSKNKIYENCQDFQFQEIYNKCSSKEESQFNTKITFSEENTTRKNDSPPQACNAISTKSKAATKCINSQFPESRSTTPSSANELFDNKTQSLKWTIESETSEIPSSKGNKNKDLDCTVTKNTILKTDLSDGKEGSSSAASHCSISPSPPAVSSASDSPVDLRRSSEDSDDQHKSHVSVPGQHPEKRRRLECPCKACKKNSVNHRQVATMKENERMKKLNEAYECLKRKTGQDPRKKMKKVDILRNAIKYIKDLEELLHGSSNCQERDCDSEGSD